MRKLNFWVAIQQPKWHTPSVHRFTYPQAFSQRGLHSTPEFECSMDRRCQALVSKFGAPCWKLSNWFRFRRHTTLVQSDSTSQKNYRAGCTSYTRFGSLIVWLQKFLAANWNSVTPYLPGSCRVPPHEIPPDLWHFPPNYQFPPVIPLPVWAFFLSTSSILLIHLRAAPPSAV